MPNIKGKTYEMIGAVVTQYVKYNPQYPYRTGNLRDNATYYRSTQTGFEIIFDENIAPYIPHLEDGVEPGVRLSTTGKTYFHKGSTKHRGFISEKSMQVIEDTLVFLLGGRKEAVLRSEFKINVRGYIE